MALYADLLGDALAALPTPLRAIHCRVGVARYRGEVDVCAGTNWLARRFAAATRLPATYVGPIEVEIVAGDTVEYWTRRFGAHAMRSRLRTHGGCLRERLGWVGFDFALEVIEATIRWRVVRVRLCGFPLPVAWFAGVEAVESAGGDVYRFEVHAELPRIGLLVHYRGWLDVR